MNSKKLLETFETTCGYCRKMFYEFEDDTLEACPYCDSSLEGCDEASGKIVTVRIDHKTGKIII